MDIVQDSGTNAPVVPFGDDHPLRNNPILSDSWFDMANNMVDSSVYKNQIKYSAEQPEIAKLANELGLKLNDDTKDYLLQYYLGQQSDKAAFDRSMEASNTQYQRAVEDLRKAGLNPFLALQSLSGSSPTSSSSGSGGGYIAANERNKNTLTSKLFTVLGIIAASIFGSMAKGLS